MLNCLAAVASVTADQDCCQSKHATLTQEVQNHLRELVEVEASQVLQRCGFTAHLTHDRCGVLPYDKLLAHQCSVSSIVHH